MPQVETYNLKISTTLLNGSPIDKTDTPNGGEVKAPSYSRFDDFDEDDF